MSVFEAHTEIIRKGKASKPTEFRKMLKPQEAENQIVTHYEVFDEKPADGALLVNAVAKQEEILGRTPELVAADAAFHTQDNEDQIQAKRTSVPNRTTRSVDRKQLQKRRWFRRGRKWRTGCEGRISVLKRRHGLDRCPVSRPGRHEAWVGGASSPIICSTSVVGSWKTGAEKREMKKTQSGRSSETLETPNYCLLTDRIPPSAAGVSESRLFRAGK